MAEEITKVIKVDTSEAQKNIKDLGGSFKSVKEAKQYIDQLTASMIGLDESSEEYQDRANQVNQVQQQLNNALNAAKGNAGAAEGSYAALAKKMSDLKKEWKATADEVKRNELGQQINNINNQLKNMDASIGVFSRNVGNYKTAFVDAFQSAVPAIGKVNTAMKGLAANPIGAVITLLVTAFMALKKALNENEAQSIRFKNAMAAFKPIVAAVTNAVQFLVEKFVGLVSWVSQAVESVTRFAAKAADFFGLSGVAEKLEGTADSMRDLKQAEEAHNESLLAKRQLEEDLAESEARRSELLNELQTNENLTAEERKKYIQEIKDSRKAAWEEERKIAQAEIEYLETQAKLSANSAEENQKIAEAKKKLADIDRSYYSDMKGYDRQTSKYNTTTAGATEAAKSFTDALTEFTNKFKQGETKNIFQELNEILDKYKKNIGETQTAVKNLESQVKSSQDGVKEQTETLNQWFNDYGNNLIKAFSSVDRDLENSVANALSRVKDAIEKGDGQAIKENINLLKLAISDIGEGDWMIVLNGQLIDVVGMTKKLIADFDTVSDKFGDITSASDRLKQSNSKLVKLKKDELKALEEAGTVAYKALKKANDEVLLTEAEKNFQQRKEKYLDVAMQYNDLLELIEKLENSNIDTTLLKAEADRLQEVVKQYREQVYPSLLQPIDTSNLIGKAVVNEDNDPILAAIKKNLEEKAYAKKAQEAYKEIADTMYAATGNMEGLMSDLFNGNYDSAIGNLNSIKDAIDEVKLSLADTEGIENNWENITSVVGGAVMALGGTLSSYADLRQKVLDSEKSAMEAEGKWTAEQQEKYEAQLENTKKIEAAGAIVSALGGAVTAFAQAMQLGPIAGPIVGATLAAAMTTMGAINARMIMNAKKGQTSASSGSSGSYTPNIASVDQYTMTRLGQTVGQETGTKVAESQTTQRVVLVQSDLEIANDRRVEIENNTEF